VCTGSTGCQAAVGRDGKFEGQDVAGVGGSQTNAGASDIARFVLKPSDELVQDFFSCFGN